MIPEENDAFQRAVDSLSDRGVWLPEPDLKRVVNLRFKSGAGLDVEGDSCHEVWKAITDVVHADELAVIFKDPVQGTDLIVTRKGVDEIICLGYSWLDLEAIKKQRSEQAFLRAATSRQRRHPS